MTVLLELLFELIVAKEDLVEFSHRFEVVSVLQRISMGIFEGTGVSVESLA